MDNEKAKQIERLMNHELAHAERQSGDVYLTPEELRWNALHNVCDQLLRRLDDINTLNTIGHRLQKERNRLAGNLSLKTSQHTLVCAERDMLAAELRLVKLQLKEVKGE